MDLTGGNFRRTVTNKRNFYLSWCPENMTKDELLDFIIECGKILDEQKIPLKERKYAIINKDGEIEIKKFKKRQRD